MSDRSWSKSNADNTSHLRGVDHIHWKISEIGHQSRDALCPNDRDLVVLKEQDYYCCQGGISGDIVKGDAAIIGK